MMGGNNRLQLTLLREDISNEINRDSPTQLNKIVACVYTGRILENIEKKPERLYSFGSDGFRGAVGL